jgi:hypothetical protein
MFTVSYLCLLEDLVCSEIEDGNTISHSRLSQCDRTQTNTEEATKVTNIIVTKLKINTFRNNTKRTPQLNTTMWTNNIQNVADSQEQNSTQMKTKVTQIRSKTQPSH